MFENIDFKKRYSLTIFFPSMIQFYENVKIFFIDGENIKFIYHHKEKNRD